VLSLDAGMVLSAGSSGEGDCTGVGACIEAEGAVPPHIILDLQMRSLSMEADFLKVDPVRGPPGVDPSQLSILANNPHGLVHGQFVALPVPGGAETKATLAFAPEASSVVLAPKSISPEIIDESFTLGGCDNLDIRIDGRVAAQPMKGRQTLILLARHFTLTHIALSRPAPGTSDTHILVEGYGTARHIQTTAWDEAQVGGITEEILPSRLEEILTAPLWAKGLFGLTVVFFIFCGTIFINRSLAVLSVLMIPDAKR
jgi:hypothetical protein